MADIDTEGSEGMDRYRAVVNGVPTLLKLTPKRAKEMGLTERVPRQISEEPSEAESAAADVATEAQHKKRTVASTTRTVRE